MKKKLLTLGAIALGLTFTNAQFISFVGNGAVVSVKKDALVYNGGGMKTVGAGKVIDEGQVMLVGNTNSKFATMEVDGITSRTTGENFILKMTDDVLGQLRYGQLYIKGLVQNNITGIVDKEFKEYKHGTYQQIALPFYGKTFSSLSQELGLTSKSKPISKDRWTQSEVLVWNNEKVVSSSIPTTNTGDLSNVAKPETAYFMIGAGKGALEVDKKHVLRGVPYADNITVNLVNAGNGINFGAGGTALNEYREKYNTYLADTFESTEWSGNFGKNIYQFGNPFFTNLDVRYLAKQLPDIQGIKMSNANKTNVVTDSDGATYSSAKDPVYFITYNRNRVAVGDVDKTIVLPMQTIVIKMKNNGTSNRSLNFDELRRFLYKSANSTLSLREAYVRSNAPQARKVNSALTGTVKQLGVIAYDKDNNEIGRTYYVVYPGAVVGQPKEASTQVKASLSGILGTYEETKEGGVDNDLKDKYWLYINEADENIFKGKDISLEIYDEYADGTKANVDHLGFEIRENANLVSDNQSMLTTGESFYIKSKGELTKISQGQNLSLSSVKSENGIRNFKLYYGKPTNSSAGSVVSSTKLPENPSETVIVYDELTQDYRLIFDTTWKKASVKVLDLNGRVVLSKDNVNAAESFVISLPSDQKAVYIVTAISEKGKQFTHKIIK